MVQIIKELGGNIRIEGIARPVSVPGSAAIRLSADRSEISVFWGAGAASFEVADVASTQILPAAPVPFSGDGLDLFRELSEDFFFEPVADSGGIENSQYNVVVSNVSPSTASLFQIPLENNTIAEAQIFFSVLKTGTNERYTNRYMSRFQCDNTGTVTAFSATSSVAENLATDIAFSVSVSTPNLVEFRGTNLAAQTTEWHLFVTLRKHTFA
jgi:hypothetical protein